MPFTVVTEIVFGAGAYLQTIGEALTLELDWPRRHALMRLHTALHDNPPP